MYIHQYQRLPMDERENTLWRYGQYLLFREDKQATYILFALGSFFVEIVASKPDETIERITCFHDTADLQPYLDGLQLSEKGLIEETDSGGQSTGAGPSSGPQIVPPS